MKIEIRIEMEYGFDDLFARAWIDFYNFCELSESCQIHFNEPIHKNNVVNFIGREQKAYAYSHDRFGSIFSFGSKYNTKRFKRNR